jgi:hypothetical protein
MTIRSNKDPTSIHRCATHLQQSFFTQRSHSATGGLQVLLQFAATTALQLVLHNDGQSLHNGFVLGCPWEDMNSIAKTATATVALRPSALETIVVDGRYKLCNRARL